MTTKRIANVLLAISALALTLYWSPRPTRAAAPLAQTVFTNQAAYLQALAALNLSPVVEGFEDDGAWGTVRSVYPNQSTAPSITNLGMTWMANNPNSEITTGSGAAFTGQWGFYTLPHGDPFNGINDGFVGTADQTIYAIGGWIRTNTPPAGLALILDGDEANPVDFDGVVLMGPHMFFGVVDTDGFTTFEFRETEATPPDELKYIFADLFTWGVATTAQVAPLSSFAVPLGTLVGGDLAALVSSDDVDLAVATATLGAAQIASPVISAVSPAIAVQALTWTVEAASANQAVVLVRAYNNVTSTWEAIGAFFVPAGDRSRQFTVATNASDYVRASDGRIATRLVMIGSTAANPGGFVATFDHLSIAVTPE